MSCIRINHVKEKNIVGSPSAEKFSMYGKDFIVFLQTLNSEGPADPDMINLEFCKEEDLLEQLLSDYKGVPKNNFENGRY